MPSNEAMNGHRDGGLSVIVVGAGIAGLATATGLAQKGHKVLVLEGHPALNEFGASIAILPNGVRVLQKFGLAEKFRPVVTFNDYWEIRDGRTDKVIGKTSFNAGNFADVMYGAPCWNINRADYQQVLADAAMEFGTEIMFDAAPERIDTERCCVILKDGREFTADVIIGADGLRSVVRHSIPATSDVEPKALFEQCFRSTVPKERMVGNPKLEWLLHHGSEVTWMGRGCYMLTWPLPENRHFDVVNCVLRESDVPAGKWGTTADPVQMSKYFEDFCPQVQEILQNIDTCVKWTLAELPPLKSCRSENGKVVLVGDAFHGMIPHAASGGNSAIEDAGALSECLDWAFRNGHNVAQATAAFEALQKPRVERMQEASREAYGFFNAEGESQVQRDKQLAEDTETQARELRRSETERRADAEVKPDMHTRFPGLPYLKWLYGYDAIEAAKEYLAHQDRSAARA